MKYKNIMIVTDLDGTFFGKGGRLIDENLAAVEKFKKGGGLFTIATGRVPKNITIFENIINVPAINCNGAFCYDFSKKQRLMQIELDYEKASEIANYSNGRFDGTLVRCSLESGEFRLTEREHIEQRPDGYYITGEREIKLEGFTRISFDSNADAIKLIRPTLEEKYSEYFSFMQACDYIYEFQAKTATKGQALDRLRRYLIENGFADSELTVYAVGDYENDLDLLSHCDIPCCPDNALDMIKDICKIHLCHHDEGAIADLISRI